MRVRSKPAKPQSKESELIEYIILANGGYAAVAALLGLKSRQHLFIWKERGRVPLKHVRRVAKALNVPYDALNFKQWALVTGKKTSWEDLVSKVKK